MQQKAAAAVVLVIVQMRDSFPPFSLSIPTFSPLFFAEPNNVQTESDGNATAAVSPPRSVPPCPLCQESFADYAALENHVMQVREIYGELELQRT